MRAFLTCLALALAALPATAQDDDDLPPVVSPLPGAAFGKAPVRLVFDHVQQSVWLEDPSGRRREVWERGEVPFARVPVDRPVVVEVRNANPLLYAYGVEAVVREALPARPTCLGRAREFVLSGALAAGGALSGGAVPTLDPGLTLNDYLAAMPAPSLDGEARGEAALTTADLIRVRQEAARAVASVAAFGQGLRAAESAAADSLVRAARWGDTRPLDPLLAAIQRDLERVRPGLSDAARIPVLVDEALDPPRDPIRRLLAASARIETGEADDPASPAARAVLALAETAQTATADALAAADALQTLALRVESAREATRQRTTLRPGDDLREVTLTLTEAADAVEGVRPTRTGVVQAFLGPREEIVGCGVAVSLVWTARPPTYDVASGRLVDAADGGVRSTAAVLFEVAPPVVGRVLGVVGGVGVGDRAPDLYLGGTVRVLAPVLVSVGAAWQRRAVLPDGLALGERLDDADLDEQAFLDAFPRRWRPALFVGLSLLPTR